MSLESISVTRRRVCTRRLARTALWAALCLLQPALASAQLVISEFRLRGIGGADGSEDEFIEIYNNSNASHTVAAISGTGYGIAASDGVTRCSIPNGTLIPGRAHYLCVNSDGYALGTYPAGNSTTATGDATYTTNIADNAGIALFNNNSGGGSYSIGNRLDAVGSTAEGNAIYKEGAGYPALASLAFNIDYSLQRRVPGGCTGSSGGGSCNSVTLIKNTAGPGTVARQDTDNNAVDFIFVDPNGTSANAGQRLGVPGPENLASPVAVDGFNLTASLADPTKAYNVAPNYKRVGGAWCGPPNPIVPPCNPSVNSTLGQLDIRQKFTNNSGLPITRLRFRVIDITTFPSISGVADLRPISSTDIVDSTLGTVRGTTLEQPPASPTGPASTARSRLARSTSPRRWR